MQHLAPSDGPEWLSFEESLQLYGVLYQKSDNKYSKPRYARNNGFFLFFESAVILPQCIYNLLL